MIRVCRVCNRKLPADPAHFVRRASGRDGLSYLCRECQRKQNCKAYKDSVVRLDNCQHCGKEFTTKNTRQVYCSQECRIISERRRKKERERLRYYRGMPAKGDYITPSNLAQPTGFAPGGCRW